eukprot:scaffold554285_cov17-Prasinocladus_malaysianus.AAC.1
MECKVSSNGSPYGIEKKVAVALFMESAWRKVPSHHHVSRCSAAQQAVIGKYKSDNINQNDARYAN